VSPGSYAASPTARQLRRMESSDLDLRRLTSKVARPVTTAAVTIATGIHQFPAGPADPPG